MVKALGSDYYERYWQKNSQLGKVAAHPPTWDEKSLKKIKALVKPYLKGKVLDVGCGNGGFTFELSKLENVKQVIGVDISRTAISQAKEKYPGLKFKTASVTDLPFPKENFDFIAAIELVEHVVDAKQMFREFNRVLKKKGKLFITTVDFNLLKKIIVAIFFWDRYFYPTNPHIRFFTKSTLEDVLSRAGFQIIDYKWNGSYFWIMPRGQIVVAEKAKELKF